MLAVSPHIPAKTHHSGPEPLTDLVCWSRMQAEAGQDLNTIVRRKELERAAGKGVFCWGVGNAPSRSIPALARSGVEIDVVFSIMKSRPKAIDASPAGIRVWRSYIGPDGAERPLPEATLITSRADTASRSKTAHYALMCRSTEALTLGDFGPFDPAAYRNASESAGAVGASQVTALLRRVSEETKAPPSYAVNLRAKLEHGYWVRLSDPIDMPTRRRAMFERFMATLKTVTLREWLEVVSEFRKGTSKLTERQPRLL